MEEVNELVLTPFMEIVEKSKVATNNAGENEEMGKSATSLAKEGQRALKKLEPICKKNFEEYGHSFVDALKDNGEITTYRDQLNELLWEFDDYVEVDEFEAEKFKDLQALSRKAALQIYGILTTMKLTNPMRSDMQSRHFMSQLSPPSSPHTGAAHLSSLDSPSSTGSAFGNARHSAASSLGEGRPSQSMRSIAGTSGYALNHQDGMSSLEESGPPKPLESIPQEPPPRPPSADPWNSNIGTEAQHDSQAPHDAYIPRRDDAESPVDPLFSPRIQPDPNAGRDSFSSQPNTLQVNQRYRSGTIDSTSTPTIPENEVEQSNGLGQDGANSSQQQTNTTVFAPFNTQWPSQHPYEPLRVEQSSQQQQQHHHHASIPAGPATPASLTGMSTLSLGAEPVVPPPFNVRGYPGHATSSIASSEALSPTGQPVVGRSLFLEEQPGLELAPIPSHPFPGSDMPIPVESEKRVSMSSSKISAWDRSTSIGNNSSFYLLKGFCPGAKEICQGAIGVKKTKKANFTTTMTVGRCTNCLYDVDFKDIEDDVNKWDEGNFRRYGITYRLRFIQKSHMTTKRPDDVLYGCLFCIQQGHTIDASDATVFFNTKALFKHLARHPRPLPAVPGVVVVESPEVPEALHNNFDVHFPKPPEAHPVIEKSVEIAGLPTGVARESARRLYGQKLLSDRSPAHELAQGARVTGLTWPEKYNGDWCFGWHEGIYASIPTDVISVDAPPMGEVKMGGMSSLQVRAKWKFAPKDKEKGEWLKFDKGETITNIGFSNPDHWCWSGNNAKGKWGMFPSAFVDTTTLGEASSSKPGRAASVSSQEKTGSKWMSFRSKSSGRPPSIAESTKGGHGSQDSPRPMMNISPTYLAYKNQQYQKRS